MKVRLERSELLDCVGWAGRAVPGRPDRQALSGLLLEADEGGLQVSGFDYVVGARARVAEAAVAESGAVLVAGRLLAEIARALPAAPVELAVQGQRLELACGSVRFGLPTLTAEDFPSLPALPERGGRIAGDEFAAAVAQVGIAAGRDDLLPVFTAVRVEITESALTLVATDRYRLAIRELAWECDVASGDLPPAALVPARTLSDVARGLAPRGGEVRITVGDGLVGFAAGQRELTTRLLEGEFPRYSALLPEASNAVAVVTCAELVEALRRVSLVVPGVGPVRCAFSADELVLSAGSSQEAQATEHVPVSYDGEPMSIAFNPHYLLDGLSALDGDKARIALTVPGKPALLSDERSGYRHLLMPMRLPDE